MYTPHTVTIYNAIENPDTLVISYNLTVLNGVFLDMSKSDNVKTSGLENADSVTLFIPFSVDARSSTGVAKTYLSPKEFERAANKSLYWTIGTGGDTSSVSTYFIKGVGALFSSYKDLRNYYDYVFDATSVDIRDYGSPHMQHWMVSGR